MCVSVFFAQVIGFFLFLVSLPMLVHQQRFKKTATDFLNNHNLVALTGWIGTLLGLLVVVCHNVWVAKWPVVITLVGWFALLQGLLRLYFPDTFVRIMKDLLTNKGYLLMSWVFLIVGLYLIWAGLNN